MSRRQAGQSMQQITFLSVIGDVRLFSFFVPCYLARLLGVQEARSHAVFFVARCSLLAPRSLLVIVAVEDTVPGTVIVYNDVCRRHSINVPI